MPYCNIVTSSRHYKIPKRRNKLLRNDERHLPYPPAACLLAASLRAYALAQPEESFQGRCGCVR